MKVGKVHRSGATDEEEVWRQINVVIPITVHSRLKAIGVKDGLPLSRVINQALRDYTERRAAK